MTVWLLDGSALVALFLSGHEQHERVRSWYRRSCSRFATCAITQGTLLRMHMRMAVDSRSGAAWATLAAIERLANHEFWEEGFSYSAVACQGLQGPGQVTDAWLVELARRRQGRLATLDVALAGLYPDRVDLIPQP